MGALGRLDIEVLGLLALANSSTARVPAKDALSLAASQSFRRRPLPFCAASSSSRSLSRAILDPSALLGGLPWLPGEHRRCSSCS